MIEQQRPKVCPVFIDCVADRIQRDDKMALDAALVAWDRYRWPIKVMAVLGRMLIKYRKARHG